MITVLVTWVAWLPLESVTLNEIVYVPTVEVFTVPDVTIAPVNTPS